MSEKRKDKKGRILRNGECQLSDGRYRYKYLDDWGKERVVYSWKLQRENRKGYSSLHTIRGVLNPAFQMAVDDDLIRKNPFAFPLGEVVINDSNARDALSNEQEQMLLDFIKEDKIYSDYYEGIYILFKTGVRTIPMTPEGETIVISRSP